MQIRILYSILVLLLSSSLNVCGQVIHVSAPSHVSTGENFRIAYTINNQNVEDFRAAGIPNGLEVIAGPYTSQQSSYQIVNGHTSRSSSITFTYTLYADKAGSYVIPGAKARLDGKTITSQSVRISVSGSAHHSTNTSSNGSSYENGEVRSAGSKISGNDLFVKVTASKRKVHEQEPILLTYKVYTLVGLTSLDGKMPDLTGFHTQEVKLPQQKSFHIEKLNGRNYQCVTWSQYVMYPQMTGKLSIPSITFKGIVVQQNRSVDPLEAFLNGGSGYVEVKRNIVAPGLDIQVDPLPAKPSNFSGGVGRFSISAQSNNASIKAGTPLTVRVVVSGIGNLKLIKQPVVDFPKDFDKYDPKIIDKTKLTANGIEGNMIYDFLVVPRNQGEYTIPAVNLTYFDTSEECYKTISTKPIAVKVTKGDGTNSSVSDYSDDKPTDIRGIKEGNFDVVTENSLFWGSLPYWLCMIIPIVAFACFVVAFRKKMQEKADIIGTRGKRANKVATKRLKVAYKLLCANSQNEFYDEVLRALWGYVGDKLNMPVEQLSRDNTKVKLEGLHISDDVVNKYISAIDECEYERYAPGDAAGNMTKTYDYAMNVIIEIENSLKTRKKIVGNISTMLLILVILCFACNVSAAPATKSSADIEYQKGNYLKASTDYEELLRSGESPELYYNLGNCYYRLGYITKSIIAYERALRLSPGDSDIRYNLQFLRGKTIDKIVPIDDAFFVVWYKACLNSMSIDGWAKIGVFAFIFALILMSCFLVADRVVLRKTYFYLSLISCLAFIVSNIFAYQQKTILHNHDKAIVVSPAANVKKTPAETSSEAFVIHEGTRVIITDDTLKEWLGVRLEDGKEGWIRTSQVEII